jgi:hypothetical protein
MREIRGTDIAWAMEERPGFGTGALVIDEDGVWPWYRRDYVELRAFVEQGFNDASDYAEQEK